MKFSDLSDKQKGELFVQDPEWLVYNRPKWMIENHLYYMFTHYSHIIDDLMSGATVDNRIDSVVNIPDNIANKIFKPSDGTKEREYQEYEFCKAVKCNALMSVCTARICKQSARTFHIWLKNNEFIIKKKL